MRRSTLLPALAAATLLAPVGAGAGRGAQPPLPRAPRDSAREEMGAGRYWHAARILRAAGAAASADPAEVLLLARAEAGWRNWPGVARVLEGASWLDAVGAGEGRFLVGRAREAQERWGDAAAAYRAYVDGAGPRAGRLIHTTRARLARVSFAAGDPVAAVAALDLIPAGADAARSWAAVDLAAAAAQAGDTALTSVLLARVRNEAALEASWRLAAQARLAAGDSLGAERAYAAVAAASSGVRRGEASAEAGRLALARRDSAAARPLLMTGFAEGAERGRARAAAALLSFRDTDLELTLGMAEVLDRASDHGPALRAYDRARNLERARGSDLSDGARLARARLMAMVRGRQDEAVEEFRAIRAGTRDERVGARNLEIWAALRRRQGRTGDVTTLRRWLLEEYPASPEAAEVRWERGSAADGRGDLTGALREYAALAEAARDHARAGQARMRTGQIHLGRGRVEEAARVYEAYLADFPRGRRWEEASYWAARARLQFGDTAAARRLVDRVRREEAVSYYAVMGADLLDEPYDVDVPEGDPPEEPAWLTEGLRRLDLLVEAGLSRGADAEETRLVESAAGSRAVTLRLAEALIERGRTVAGINLGWTVRREGASWDRHLLGVVYPFPYRELVVREAAEWGLDPILLAALIRQESAFASDVRSSAGAVGLMQVMPPTGRALARAHGPDDFREEDLEAPEVNLHLGAAFFVDMSRRYGGDLPLVLAAYNAGPARATRWRRYPEVSDPPRFTERIPFEETRGYVKNVRRNLGLYQVLYGDR